LKDILLNLGLKPERLTSVREKITSFLIFVILATGLHAQDIHFSQFLSSPLNLNPALCGSYEGDLRLCLNHKGQWQSFANAYSTFSASFDANLKVPFVRKSRFGAGLLLNSDKSGDGNLSTNQVKINLSWHQPITGDSSLFVSAGVNAGFTNHGVDVNLLHFGSQYIDGQFNPDAPANETFVSDKISYFDYSAGLNIGYISKSTVLYHIGFSVQHINEPEKSFNQSDEIVLPRKYVYHAGCEWNIKDDLFLDPFIMFMHQGTYIESDVGAIIRVAYNPLGLKYIFTGLSMRSRDSGILMMGANYQNIRLTLSYDINLSKLSTISYGRGGIELSLIYIYQKPRPYEPPYYRKCPEFM